MATAIGLVPNHGGQLADSRRHNRTSMSCGSGDSRLTGDGVGQSPSAPGTASSRRGENVLNSPDSSLSLSREWAVPRPDDARASFGTVSTIHGAGKREDTKLSPKLRTARRRGDCGYRSNPHRDMAWQGFVDSNEQSRAFAVRRKVFGNLIFRQPPSRQRQSYGAAEWMATITTN